MYNLFKYEKDQATAKETKLKIEQERERIRSAYSVTNRLYKNYKKRRIHVLKSAEPVFRSDASRNNQFVGEPFIRHRPKNSAERVNDSLSKNKWLDTIPNPQPLFKLRKRTRSKEIHGDFRFTPKDTLQRLQDTWNYQKDFLNLSWNVSKNPNRSYYKTIETVAFNSINEDPEIVKLARETVDKTNLRAKSIY